MAAPRTEISASRGFFRSALVTVKVSALPCSEAEPFKPRKVAGCPFRVYGDAGDEITVLIEFPFWWAGVHVEYMIRRRQRKVVFVSNEKRLQAVHQLRNVGSADLFGVTMEGVER
jgi:hypothetical protein